MSLLIGKVIQKNRKIKNMTQEQMAECLGVSSVAVSKWESNSTYPDITMLSPLARLLEVNLDTLLNFEEKLSQEDVLKIESKCRENFSKLAFDESVKLCEDFLKEYPSDLNLKIRIGTLILTQMYIPTNDIKDSGKIINKIIQIVEPSAQSDNLNIKESSISLLSAMYLNEKNYDKSLEYANQLVRPTTEPLALISNIYAAMGDENKSKEIQQNQLMSKIESIKMILIGLAKIEINNNNFQDALEMLDTCLKLTGIFQIVNFRNEDIVVYQMKAEIYAKQKMQKETLGELENVLSCISKKPTNTNLSNNMFFDKLIVNSNYVSNKDVRNVYKASISKNNNFDFLIGNAEFEKIISSF